MLGNACAIRRGVRTGTAHMECGGLPPLFAERACPGVLRAFASAWDWARQASPKNSGSKLPHSTWAEAPRVLGAWLHSRQESLPGTTCRAPTKSFVGSVFTRRSFSSSRAHRKTPARRWRDKPPGVFPRRGTIYRARRTCLAMRVRFAAAPVPAQRMWSAAACRRRSPHGLARACCYVTSQSREGRQRPLI
jgi:hypothetical protein